MRFSRRARALVAVGSPSMCGRVARGLSTNSATLNRVGRTAFFVNELRKMEAERPTALFEDEYSTLFSTAETAAMAAAVSEQFRFFQLWMGARTQYIDAAIREAAADGAEQAVVVGSGLDCRPLRLRELGLRWFECDQAAVLDYKRSVIPDYPATTLACNYTEADLRRDFPGFDETRPTVFLWEGGSMYHQAPLPLLQSWLAPPLPAVVVLDSLTAVLARPDGAVDVGGDAEATACLQVLMDTLGGGTNIWSSPLDVPDAARSLDLRLLDLADSLTLIHRYYRLPTLTDLAEHLLDGDSDTVNVIATISREYYLSTLANQPWLDRRP